MCFFQFVLTIRIITIIGIKCLMRVLMLLFAKCSRTRIGGATHPDSLYQTMERAWGSSAILKESISSRLLLQVCWHCLISLIQPSRYNWLSQGSPSCYPWTIDGPLHIHKSLRECRTYVYVCQFRKQKNSVSVIFTLYWGIGGHRTNRFTNSGPWPEIFSYTLSEVTTISYCLHSRLLTKQKLVLFVYIKE